MKLVFFGTPEFAVPSLERLLADARFEVLAVVTQPDKRRGRGNELSPAPIKTVALTHALPIWQPRRIKKDRETLDSLRALPADAFVVVAYGQILSPEILEMPRWGCINGHGSILPKYRGAAPIQWSLYHGEPETGITTMLMDAGMDTGPMLLKATTPIALLDNAQTLAQRLSHLTAELLVETLLQLEAGTLEPTPQEQEQATYAPLIQKEDYRLDWNRSALALHHQICGFYPNCVTALRGTTLKVVATVPLDPAVERTQLPPALQQFEWTSWLQTAAPTGTAPVGTAPVGTAPVGTVVGLLKQQGAVVQTGQGLLLLREVQLAGKRAQAGWDFVNGTRLQVGEVLGE